MLFFYNGKKPSKGFGIANSILLLVVLLAVIFMFSLLDSFDDFEKYFIELLLVLIIGVGMFYSFFRKKSKLHTYKIEIKDNFLNIDSIKIPLENIQLTVFKKSNKFCRYHLFDEKGVLSIYSIYKDDLLDYISKNHPKKTIESTEISSSKNGEYVKVNTNIEKLEYNLETGNFSIEKEGKIVKKLTPELYVYDPRYKQGIPFNQRKQNDHNSTK